jgi:uncharacterized damage-inducible protein DinB
LKHQQKALALLGLFAAFSASTLAQTDPPSSPSPMRAAPATTGGVRTEALNELSYFEKRFTDLANAMPADKYTWRPAEGVRSVSEVFLHVAAANYNIPRLLGTQPPAGIDVRGLEKSTTDKAKIIETLKNSFAHTHGAILTLSDTDVEKSVKLLGKDNTYRGVMIFILRHLGEHLGQSIAYARINGVVPPWTEEQQRQQKQQPPQQPPQKPKP